MTHNANEGAALLIARLCDKNNESPWRGVQEALAGRTQKGIDQATRSVRKESMRVESVAQSEAESLVVLPMSIQERSRASSAVHDKKNELRNQHRALVGTAARKAGIDHRQLNAELIKRTGGQVDQATVAQLVRRIPLLEKSRDSGFDGDRAQT